MWQPSRAVWQGCGCRASGPCHWQAAAVVCSASQTAPRRAMGCVRGLSFGHRCRRTHLHISTAASCTMQAPIAWESPNITHACPERREGTIGQQPAASSVAAVTKLQ
ncbi:hypothetical protein B0T26DRAFT_517255 [Lasiosphaeria miniovina]|uniref:Uncharacterized protein n=1 Tax=Lasiosphaeria miniovina TaxID=1954250 RepID=A0AA40DJP8_9PEZI|nr:uncharacterized protein B0T26DRAFT_517255 [Lasiosphaeria miniovina]KAK0703881.1 hypothetical protein B0T26DRAFT_517255 [Lasiosphaeria miniovina]